MVEQQPVKLSVSGSIPDVPVQPWHKLGLFYCQKGSENMGYLLKLLKKATVSGVVEFDFGVPGHEFLVKNFTANNIQVYFDESETNPITIPPDTAQVCFIRDSSVWNFSGTNKVYVKSDAADESGVEIQCTRWGNS